MSAAVDFYALLGLPQCFALDREQLDAAYRECARRAHPDRHVQGAAAAQEQALSAATAINEAYRILKDPARRAAHLLALRGVDASQARPSSALLMQQMTWHETLDSVRDSGDGDALQRLGAELRAQLHACEARLAAALDAASPDTASACLLEFGFLRRLLDAVVEADEEVNV